MPSPLIAKLVASVSSSFTLGTDETQVLKVDPSAASVNPNEVNTSMYFDGIQYICRCITLNETWPKYMPNSSLMQLAGGAGVVPSASMQTDGRNVSGCFRQGPGGLVLPMTAWTIAGSWFAPSMQYSVGVIVWKTYLVDGVNVSINAMNTITLMITAGSPPNLMIVYVTQSVFIQLDLLYPADVL
jgi:hypothetical protein